MKKSICLFALFLLLSFCTKALTVYSVLHNDWSNPFSWSTGQVPTNPDTIILKHYITFSSNLTIAAPTVLIIDSLGTLCGDFQLDVSCGARVINYGNIFVNSAIVRDMYNYKLFWSKNYVNIYACNLPGFGVGIQNGGPNSSLMVWPPVLCRTSGTNWIEGGLGVEDNSFTTNSCVYPNPCKDFFVIKNQKYNNIEIKDFCGKTLLIQEIIPMLESTIDVSFLKSGVYLVILKCETKTKCFKLVHI